MAFGVGMGLPLGVMNIAIVEAASSGRGTFARGLAIGGGAADAMQAAAAFVGIGALALAERGVKVALAIAATVVVVAYVATTWRWRKRKATDAGSAGHSFSRGVGTGLLLTLPNPGPLGVWVVIAATWPVAGSLGAAAVAVGVATGSMLWFSLLAHLVSRIARVRPDHPAIKRIAQGAAVAAVVFVALALVGVARAFL